MIDGSVILATKVADQAGHFEISSELDKKKIYVLQAQGRCGSDQRQISFEKASELSDQDLYLK